MQQRVRQVLWPGTPIPCQTQKRLSSEQSQMATGYREEGKDNTDILGEADERPQNPGRKGHTKGISTRPNITQLLSGQASI